MTPPMVGLTVFGGGPDEAVLFEQLGPRFGVRPTVTSRSVAEVRALSTGIDRCISVDHASPVDGPALRALRRAGVEHVSTRSIGLDHVDLAAARALGIAVENVVYAPDGVADYTVMLILMAIRDISGIVEAARRQDFRLRSHRAPDLRDMTVGVVGAGSIGLAVIRRLQGFGCRVLVCSTARPPVAAELVALDALLRESDVVTLHLPLTPETRHVIDGERLAAMKRGAFLINTGRGALVDTGALITALESGRLGGAALDVIEGEEGVFYVDHRASPVVHDGLRTLQRLPNVTVTPHTAYFTERALRDTVEGALVRCRRFENERRGGRVETEGRDLVRGLL